MPSSHFNLPHRRKKGKENSVLSKGCHQVVHLMYLSPTVDLSDSKVNTGQLILPQDPHVFYVNGFPLAAQFMSFYSTDRVTFRLWHLFLFRYQAWFLGNQLAPLPLTSPIRELPYSTSKTGQTEIDPGQISV